MGLQACKLLQQKVALIIDYSDTDLVWITETDASYVSSFKDGGQLLGPIWIN